MKLAVFGITGGTGRFFLPAALARGHSLRVLVRNPTKIAAALANLKDPAKQGDVEIVEGDANRAADVAETVKGAQAVVSLLGHTKTSANNLQEVFIQQALEAMQQEGIRRIVVLTGSGLFFPEDKPNWTDKLIVRILQWVDPYRLLDAQKQAEILMNSQVDWTLVRTPLHTNWPSQSDLIIGQVGTPGMGLTVSRQDIVQFILDILEQPQYHRTTPAIANRQTGLL